jgi:hypothetical protein
MIRSYQQIGNVRCGEHLIHRTAERKLGRTAPTIGAEHQQADGMRANELNDLAGCTALCQVALDRHTRHTEAFDERFEITLCLQPAQPPVGTIRAVLKHRRLHIEHLQQQQRGLEYLRQTQRMRQCFLRERRTVERHQNALKCHGRLRIGWPSPCPPIMRRCCASRT